MRGESGFPAPAPREPVWEALETFVRLFNRGEFWESHEVLEIPWRVAHSEFLQGMILFASAFVHVQRGNVHGIGAQLTKATDRLTPYAPAYLGLDVTAVLTAAAEARRSVVRGDLPVPPVLDLARSRVRGDEPELGTAG
jgi:predicted metal-dependent hydrolase